VQQIEPTIFKPLSDKVSTSPFSFRASSALVLISLLILIFIAWFLFTGKSVYIATNPENTSIIIEGGLHLKLADRYLLRSGEYELSISTVGYYPLKQKLTVGKNQNQKYSFQLNRLPGHLRVNTGPVTGAEIFIDNIYMAKTPTVVRDIPHGEHQLVVSADRYFPIKESVLIEGLDQEQTIEIDLRPAWAEVEFSTEPDGADILVDDKSIILEGEHTLRIKLPGYKVWQKEIKVIASAAMSFTDIKLELADAVVFLVSNPPRVSTTVDGLYKGLTPLELALTPGKKTAIRLFKQGYQPASRHITAASGDHQRLNISLKPELVAVVFNILPADAKLYIDGRLRGPAKQTLQLSARKHRIEIRKAGFVDYKTTITPLTGVAQQLNIELKTIRQAKLEKIKPVITTTAGQTLKLFYPTPFTMGASRREPGRRANETLRKINLTRPYYLGIHEVTNKQYRLFNKDYSSGQVQGTSLNRDNQPVVNINWEQAALYCNWLSASESLSPFYKAKDNKISGINPGAMGYRLPTEAEWAWGARLTRNNVILKFPWGKEMPPLEKSGNYADEFAAGLVGRVIRNYKDGFTVSAPVGSFQSNDKGLFDMGGNVAEWINDYYDIAIGFADKTELNPLGPDKGNSHVIRGSSWAHGTITELRLSYRDYNTKTREDLGFRLARYLE